MPPFLIHIISSANDWHKGALKCAPIDAIVGCLNRRAGATFNPFLFILSSTCSTRGGKGSRQHLVAFAALIGGECRGMLPVQSFAVRGRLS